MRKAKYIATKKPVTETDTFVALIVRAQVILVVVNALLFLGCLALKRPALLLVSKWSADILVLLASPFPFFRADAFSRVRPFMRVIAFIVCLFAGDVHAEPVPFIAAAFMFISIFVQDRNQRSTELATWSCITSIGLGCSFLYWLR